MEAMVMVVLVMVEATTQCSVDQCLALPVRTIDKWIDLDGSDGQVTLCTMCIAIM